MEARANQDPFPDLDIPRRIFFVENMTSGERSVKRTRSNVYVVIRNCRDCGINVFLNQRCRKLVIRDCTNVTIQLLDSLVVMSETIELVNCHGCTLMFEACFVRNVNMVNVTNTRVQYDDDSLPTYEDCNLLFHGGCSNNSLEVVHIIDGTDPNKVTLLPVDVTKTMAIPDNATSTPLQVRLTQKVSLKFAFVNQPIRTADAIFDEVKQVEEETANLKLKDEEWGALFEKEVALYEEPNEELRRKARLVAEMLRQAKHTVVYTGAGISTAAKIPDYRGPQGAWTLRAQGIMLGAMKPLSQAEPTYSHYALTHLLNKGLIHYIVSTNMDGLHRRSGTKAEQISELHGNCFREICAKCRREYLRGFDVLLSRMDRWTHLTGRHCACGGPLKDTIVHFTEHMPPEQTDLAVSHARQADLALVLGTSMNVQPAASYPPKALENPNGKFVLVNLQKTPYDRLLSLKIYGKVDEFMAMVMEELGLKEFDQTYDHLQVVMEAEADEIERLEEGRLEVQWATILGSALLVAAAYVKSLYA